jgi:HK97 family phage portal protein
VWGESYWHIRYQRGGQPGELWWLPPWSVHPQWPSDGSEFISHYDYEPEQGTKVRLELDEVIHFRHGMDPRNARHGLPPLRAIIREIWADDESSNWIGSLLRNMGIPGMILSPKGDGNISSEESDSVKAYVKGRFTGDQRGEPMVLGGPTQVDRLSWSPNEMDLSVVRNTAEERVCAALGIPAAVVGFGTGLDTTKVGATMHEFVRLAWTNGIIPVQRLMADELQRVLLPQFEPDADRFLVSWNYDEVESLTESQNDLAKRVDLMVRGGWLKVSEARQAMGYEADPEDEIYLRPSSVQPVDPTDQMPEPEPMPALPPAMINGNGARNGNGNGNAVPREQRALKQPGDLEEWITTEIGRHAGRMDNPPRHLVRLGNRLWRAERRLHVRFEKSMVKVLQQYGRMVRTAAQEILLPPKKADIEDLIRTHVVVERVPFIAIRAELETVYRELYQEMVELTLKIMREAAEVEPTDPGRIDRHISMLARERVRMLDLTTEARDGILQILAEGRTQGLDEEAMIQMIEQRIPAGRWRSVETRAQTIVQTETRFAQNMTSAQIGRDLGARLLCVDARLGPTDEPCELRNGFVVTPSQAEQLSAVEHPRGTLGFIVLNQAMAAQVTSG